MMNYVHLLYVYVRVCVEIVLFYSFKKIICVYAYFRSITQQQTEIMQWNCYYILHLLLFYFYTRFQPIMLHKTLRIIIIMCLKLCKIIACFDMTKLTRIILYICFLQSFQNLSFVISYAYFLMVRLNLSLTYVSLPSVVQKTNLKYFCLCLLAIFLFYHESILFFSFSFL